MAKRPEPGEEPEEELVGTTADSPQAGAADGSAGASLQFVEATAEYRGPLPPPRMLADYNNVLPGLAERIVHMAESEQRHGHMMERRYAALRFTGQFAAFVIAMAGLVIGALLIRDGHNIEGLATLLVGLGPVVGAFLYRQIKATDVE